MAQCRTCSDPRIREINRGLLLNRRTKDLAVEFGYSAQTLRWHREHHLPWKKRGTPAPVTTEEKLKDLEYQFLRLQALGECGERIDQALKPLVALRALLELQLRREGRLDGTHRPLVPDPVEGEFEVVFEGGRPKTLRKAS
jgi:hypothetical protein